MDIDFAAITPQQRYKLLASVVVPRPIAFVTSVNPDGVVNAAPYSFFNCFGTDPGLVILAVGNRPEGGPKDTAANIAARGEFVVNLVDEAIAERMNAASVDFPAGMSEPEQVGLPLGPCAGTTVPRIAESPASFACRHHATQHVGTNRIVLGEILAATFRDGLVDPSNFHVDLGALHMVGRMASPGWYTKTHDQFELPRPSYEEWRAQHPTP